MKVKKIKNVKKDYERAFNCFIEGGIGKFGKYFSLKNGLVYRTIMTSDYGKKQSVEQNIIARKINNEIIVNTSSLPLIGMLSSFGRVSINRDVTPIQELMAQHFTSIPFTVFETAGLDLAKFEVVDRGPEETIMVDIVNPKFDKYKKEDMLKKGISEKLTEARHFTGASLFKVEDSLYLFDIDRVEITHRLFNAFLVEIPEAVKDISEAYIALKPKEVDEAEKSGKKVLRQGEWFFIECSEKPNEETRVFGEKGNREKHYYSKETYKLQAGRNRPNRAEIGFSIEGVAYVQGLIEHDGREHYPLDLGFDSFFKAIPNTATNSFTIEGDID